MINRVFSFLIIFTILTGCANLPTKQSVSAVLPGSGIRSNLASDPISVKIELLEPLTPGESILIAKLDVISGAWIDPEFFSVTQIDETHFEASLPRSDSAILRYKYLKVGTDQIEEINSSGQAFGYRTLNTRQITEMTDVISGWQGTGAANSSGRLVGTILSSEGDAALGGVSVEVQGRTATTDIFGRYEISGLPAGTFFVRFDGEASGFTEYQQLAVIQSDSVTVADVWLQKQQLVDVTFQLSIGGDVAEGSDIFLIGDSKALGFSSSTNPILKPMNAIRMSKGSGGHYEAVVLLPVSTEIQYKYTFGDGFWGAERDGEGELFTRSIVVGSSASTINDSLTNLGGQLKKITIQASPDLPNNVPLFIQFNAFGWTEPIPLTRDASGGYVITLAQPSELVTSALIQVCAGEYEPRNCAKLNNEPTPTIAFDNIESSFNITSWQGMFIENHPSDFAPGVPSSNDPEGGFSLRKFSNGEEILSAIDSEVLNGMQGSAMIVELSATMEDDGYRFVTEYDGLTIGDPAVVFGMNQLREKGLVPWLYLNITESHSSADPAFSGSDLNQLDRFDTQLNDQLINFVQAANLVGVDTIVIGGEGLDMAVPGEFAVESASTLWQNAIKNLREHFGGRIYYSTRYNNFGLSGLPAFEMDVDGFLVDWSTATAVTDDQGLDELTANINLMLEYDIIPSIPLGKRIIIRANAPSNTGVLLGCANNDQVNCVVVDGGAKSVDTESQALVYQAFMNAIANRGDVEGFISGGFDPLGSRVDTSASVFGKPALADLVNWFKSISQ